MTFGVESDSSVAIDEDEFWTKNEASSVSVGAHWNHSATTEIIVDLAFPRDHPGALMRSKVNTTGNNEWILMFFT